MTSTISRRRRAPGSKSLRDRICAAFEQIERESASDAAFVYSPWERTDVTGEPGGGGVRGQMIGKVFEKVGVNVSTVGGQFSPEFAQGIPGAEDDPRFFATGISLVAHMANPHVPAVHMNTRFLTTTKRWFGGGADLNPAIALRGRHRSDSTRGCAPPALPTTRPSIRASRNGPTNISGSRTVAFRAASAASSTITSNVSNRARARPSTRISPLPAMSAKPSSTFPKIVRKRMEMPFTDQDMEQLLEFRGRYVEFNLLYDRGTLFGLKTGGNIDAILMSLPPMAKWA